MNIVKSRGGMAAMLAVMALASASVLAQAPAGGPPGGGPPRMGGPGGGMGGGMGGAADRPTMIQRQGLNDPALKLSDAQKAQIDKIIDGYLVEQKTVNEKFPMAQGSPPSAEAMAARTKLREGLTAAVGKVLDDTQRKTWEAAQATRRGPGGGMGGPGGPGMGGPGAGGPPPGR